LSSGRTRRAVVIYTTDPVTPAAQLDALANVYRFVLDSANKNAAGVTSTTGGDAKERFEDVSSAVRDYTI